MKAREIILRPIITEKTTLMQERENTVCFEVNRKANKIEIRNAVEELFRVRVANVRIVNRKGKPQLRYGRVASHRPTIRRAFVKLAEGEKTPEFFEAI
jgi:large subunit ribosomal protein L23